MSERTSTSMPQRTNLRWWHKTSSRDYLLWLKTMHKQMPSREKPQWMYSLDLSCLKTKGRKTKSLPSASKTPSSLQQPIVELRLFLSPSACPLAGESPLQQARQTVRSSPPPMNFQEVLTSEPQKTWGGTGPSRPTGRSHCCFPVTIPHRSWWVPTDRTWGTSRHQVVWSVSTSVGLVLMPRLTRRGMWTPRLVATETPSWPLTWWSQGSPTKLASFSLSRRTNTSSWMDNSSSTEVVLKTTFQITCEMADVTRRWIGSLKSRT